MLDLEFQVRTAIVEGMATKREFFGHVKRHAARKDVILSILCRLCGRQVGRLNDQDETGWPRGHAPAWVALEGHRNVWIQFKNGRVHVTVLCASCVPTLTLGVILRLVASDLDALLIEHEIHGEKIAPVPWESYAGLVDPVAWGVEDHAGAGPSDRLA